MPSKYGEMLMIMQTKLYEFGIYCNEEERYHKQTTLKDWGLECLQ